jgi:hypothetical protein
MKRLSLSFVSVVFVMLLVPVAPVFAQSTPVNYIGVNFSPITTSTSYNYDWSTGTLNLGLQPPACPQRKMFLKAVSPIPHRRTPTGTEHSLGPRDP